MLIKPITGTIRATKPILQKIATQKLTNVAQGVSDVFQRATQEYTPEVLTKILNGNHLKITKEFLASLPKDAYDFCVKYAKTTEATFKNLFGDMRLAVFPDDVKDILKYSDGFIKGLEKFALQNKMNLKDVRLVSIGQSPATVVKTLELKGIRTGYCPLSGLRTIRNPLEYVTPETIKKGFSQWKEFGFDLKSLFSEKFIVFVDHYETGITIEKFKQIMSKIQSMIAKEMVAKGVNSKDIHPAKLKFVSLADIFRKQKLSGLELSSARDTEDMLFHSSYLKTLYSPLFKQPLDKICQINKLKGQNIEANRRFNKLSVLLYDEMLHPASESGFKSLAMTKGQRESRLYSLMKELFE